MPMAAKKSDQQQSELHSDQIHVGIETVRAASRQTAGKIEAMTNRFCKEAGAAEKADKK
jgi:hypothetical protein